MKKGLLQYCNSPFAVFRNKSHRVARSEDKRISAPGG
jgi:hypothetical protein